MLTDEAWIRGEIECCDLHPSDHSRRMKAALLELLAAREVVKLARAAEQYNHVPYNCVMCNALNRYDEATR